MFVNNNLQSMSTQYNPVVLQNATWEIQLTIKDGSNNPIDVSTYTGQSQIRKSYQDATVLASPTVAVTDGPNGIITVTMTTTQTASLKASPLPPAAPAPYVWDVLLSNADESVTLRIIEGYVTVKAGVTHWV